MSIIKLATLFVFLVFVTASFVRCINDGINWDLYGEYSVSPEDSTVVAVANYVARRIQARNPCYTPLRVVFAAEQSGPNVIRYQIRLAVRYDVDLASTIREGYMDVVANYPTINNERGMFQIVSMDMRGWVRYRNSGYGNVDHCNKNPRRQCDH